MGAQVSDCAGACVDNVKSGGTGSTTWLEERCTVLATENEALRRKVRELEARNGGAGGVASPVTPLLQRQGSLQYGSMKFSGRQDDDNTLTSAAAVVAAAEATATYQRSLVQVEVDNNTTPEYTMVTVRAPNRVRLLGDMCGALTGLGLSIKVRAPRTAERRALVGGVSPRRSRPLRRPRVRCGREGPAHELRRGPRARVRPSRSFVTTVARGGAGGVWWLRCWRRWWWWWWCWWWCWCC
jgi:hypothetical protein